MKPVIKPETWGYIDEFFREIPEAFEIPIIQKTMDEKFRLAVEKVYQETYEKNYNEAYNEAYEEAISPAGRMEHLRTVMIYTLKRKFGNSNEEHLETIIETIELIDDPKLLDRWFDLMIDTHFLHELKLEQSNDETEESDEI